MIQIRDDPGKAPFKSHLVKRGNSYCLNLDPVLLDHLDYADDDRLGFRREYGPYGRYATLYVISPDAHEGDDVIDRPHYIRSGLHGDHTHYVSIARELCGHLDLRLKDTVRLQTEHGQYGPYISLWNPESQEKLREALEH